MSNKVAIIAANGGVPAIPQLVEMAQELGVKFIACQMTMDVMGLTKDDFVDGIEVGGAVTFLERMQHPHYHFRSLSYAHSYIYCSIVIPSIRVDRLYPIKKSKIYTPGGLMK